MKVLLLSHAYPPALGGEERHVQNLAHRLVASGHEVHVGTQAPNGRRAVAVDDMGVHVHPLPSVAAKFPAIHADPQRPEALPVPDPVLTSALRGLVRWVNPEVVHAHNWIANSYLPVQQYAPRPLVMSLHGYAHRCAVTRYMHRGSICAGPKPARCLGCSIRGYGFAKGPAVLASTWLMKPWKERLIDRFLPVSRAVADGTGLAARGLRYEIVSNFIPDSLLESGPPRVRPADLPDEDYLLFVGDLAPDKGVATILEAYSKLSLPKPKLLLVGRPTVDGPGVLPAGVVIGMSWTHERVVEAFQHAVAAVLPSEWPDPCPTTVLEAMALGTPLITTPVGGIVGMVDHESALLVAPGDAEALRHAMTRVVRDAGLRKQLTSAAAVRVKAFTASAVVPQIERVYVQVIDERRTKVAV
jgi:glycosyltransferase involved in cell wall biosynthesis